MKKINVNEDACIGCGACVAIAPDYFAFNDEGLSHPINNDEVENEEVLNAIDACPTSAISLTDGNDCDCNCDCENESCDCNCGCDDCHCTEEHNCGCHCFEEE